MAPQVADLEFGRLSQRLRPNDRIPSNISNFQCTSLVVGLSPEARSSALPLVILFYFRSHDLDD